jgi:hypothetical protein
MQRQIMLTALAAGFLTLTCSGVRGAGTNAAEEAAIRKQIAAYDASYSSSGNRGAFVLPDEVFWSGSYKRPILRPAVPEDVNREGSAINRVPGSQRNSKTQVIRIVVADSHDLAWEYNKHTVEFDLKTGGHMSFDVGQLRAWQKQAGEWKIAADFNFRYDQP